MTQIEVLVLFVDLFHIKTEIDEWFPNGENSIRVRLKEGVPLPFNIPKVDLIFSATSRENWRLETVESFINTTLVGTNASEKDISDAYEQGRADEKKYIIKKLEETYLGKGESE